MNHTLFAGAGWADTTPEVGGMLYGYNDDTYSTSCHDHLEIKALALRSGDAAPVLMMSFALADFGTACCTQTREAIAQACDIPFENVLASSTHTHSAPNCAGQAGWGDVDRPYLEGILIPGAVKAAKEALASMQPAEFAVVCGESEVGVNRREITVDGKSGFGQNFWGPQDKTMTVIRFRNIETKKGIFQFIHYGCHGTAAGNNHEISRDWIGIMTDRMGTETGIPTGFWNGCVGDIGPRIANGLTTGDIRHVEELGGRAALDAIRIARQFAHTPFECAPVTLHAEDIALPVRPLPAREVVETYMNTHERDGHYVNIDGLIHAYMCDAYDMYVSGGQLPSEKPLPVSVVTLGDAVAFCPTPYELFSEICLRIRDHGPCRHNLAMSLTNGYEAYLPSESALCRGGYEVECFCYGNVAALADNTDTVLIKHFMRILNSMKRI